MNSYLKTFLLMAAIGLGIYAVSKTLTAKNLIKQLEGFSATPYKDADGYSIGYGHFIVAGDPYWPVGNVQQITESEADALLDRDMAIARDTVLRYTRVPLSSNQLDALTSFVYNIGVSAFAGSTLLKKLNAGDFSGALAEFGKWIHSDGEVSNTLIARRQTEQTIFSS